MESNSDNLDKSKLDSVERLNISDGIENKSPTEYPLDIGKRKFGEHLTFPRKLIKIENGRNVSPSLSVKASSIAGLSPLLKRTKSADLHKLSPANNDKTETFSILKKPRLIQQNAKKIELRSSKWVNVATFGEDKNIREDEKSNEQTQNSKFLPQSSLSRAMNLDNRYRFGSLSKPTQK